MKEKRLGGPWTDKDGNYHPNTQFVPKRKRISEEELDRLAIKAEKVTFLDTELPFQTKWVEGFKAGYRKAKGV